MIFTVRLRRMERGLSSETMDVAGVRRSSFMIRAGSRIVIMGIGFIRTMAGIGLRIIHGVGCRFIMAAGFMIRT